MDPRWLLIALREMGVAETPGPGDNPRIVDYHAATLGRFRDDEVPWCSSFLNWCMAKAGFTPTGSAMARSWLTWGVPLDQPRLGAVTVFQRGTPPAGHVGLHLAGDEELVWVLGGNQGDRVSVAPYPRARLLGYRWPKVETTTPV